MSDLHDLVKAGNNIKQLVERLKAGENPNVKNEHDDTLLHFVASRKEVNPQDLDENLLLARELIRFGANVDAQNKLGCTPLMKAIQARNSGMAEFLLQENARVNVRDNYGSTALHHAARQCGSSLQNGYDVINDPDLHLVRILLKFNPKLDVRNKSNRSPLMMAVKKQNLPIVQELLKQKASVNLASSTGRHAIHDALDQENVNVDIVLELMRYGCQFNIRSMYGKTPIDLYMHRLRVASTDELAKAKYVLKCFLFRHHTLTSFEMRTIERISREKNCRLIEFIRYCKNEVWQMQCDNFAPGYFVYEFALWGFYRRTESHVPRKVFDTVLNKLMKVQYPVYSDLIVSGICSPYLNKKFAEICYCGKNTRRGLLNYRTFYKLSFYLSHMDMLNMMIACSQNNGGN